MIAELTKVSPSCSIGWNHAGGSPNINVCVEINRGRAETTSGR
jgi:hypothetical protein